MAAYAVLMACLPAAVAFRTDAGPAAARRRPAAAAAALLRRRPRPPCRGVLYEHQPDSPVAARLARAMSAPLAEAAEAGVPRLDASTAAAMRRRRGGGQGVPPHRGPRRQTRSSRSWAGAEAAVGRRADGPAARRRRRPPAGAAGGRPPRRRRPANHHSVGRTAGRPHSAVEPSALSVRLERLRRLKRRPGRRRPCATLGGSRARRRLLRGSSCRSGRGRASALSHGKSLRSLRQGSHVRQQHQPRAQRVVSPVQPEPADACGRW